MSIKKLLKIPYFENKYFSVPSFINQLLYLDMPHIQPLIRRKNVKLIGITLSEIFQIKYILDIINNEKNLSILETFHFNLVNTKKYYGFAGEMSHKYNNENTATYNLPFLLHHNFRICGKNQFVAHKIYMTKAISLKNLLGIFWVKYPKIMRTITLIKICTGKFSILDLFAVNIIRSSNIIHLNHSFGNIFEFFLWANINNIYYDSRLISMYKYAISHNIFELFSYIYGASYYNFYMKVPKNYILSSMFYPEVQILDRDITPNCERYCHENKKNITINGVRRKYKKSKNYISNLDYGNYLSFKNWLGIIISAIMMHENNT